MRSEMMVIMLDSCKNATEVCAKVCDVNPPPKARFFFIISKSAKNQSKSYIGAVTNQITPTNIFEIPK